MKKVLESVFDTIINFSEDLTKAMMLTSIKNNKALKKSIEKLLEILNDWYTSTLFIAASI